MDDGIYRPNNNKCDIFDFFFSLLCLFMGRDIGFSLQYMWALLQKHKSQMSCSSGLRMMACQIRAF